MRTTIKKISEVETGLNFKSLTPDELRRVWQYEVQVYGHTKAEELADIKDIKPKIESFFRNMVSYFNDQTLTTFFLKGRDSDHSYITFYNRESDMFTWMTDGEAKDDENTVEGRLTVVRKLYIENELYMDANSEWNEQAGEYRIRDYYIFKTLNAKGIEYSEYNKNADGASRWSINDDVYEIKRHEDTILKNGDVIGYLYTSYTGISSIIVINSSVFEEITGTAVRYDEQTRSIYIELNK